MKKLITLFTLCALTATIAYSQPGNGNPFGNMTQEQIEELFRKMTTPPSDASYRMEVIGCQSNGNQLYGEAFIPVAPGKHPAVILSHGYGGTHHGFYGLADKLAKAYYDKFYDGFDIYKEIAKYQGDVLIVHGTEDSLVKPEYSAKASNVYKNCELHLLFGAPHGFYQPQHVELYHNYVMDFLKRHVK